MKLRYGILGLVLLLALGAQGGGCGNGVVGVQDYGTVTGRVIDAATNKPLAGALVSVGSLYTAYADAQGAFTIPTIPTGEQTVTARAPGYFTDSVVATIHKDQTTSVDYVRLSPSVHRDGTAATPVPSPPPTPEPTLTPGATPTPSPVPSGSP
jgi:hypothetical protein